MPISVFLFRLVVTLSVFVVLDIYGYQALRTATESANPQVARWVRRGFWAVTVLFWAFVVFVLLTKSQNAGPSNPWSRALGGAAVLIYFPKLVVAFVLLGEDVYRVLMAGWDWLRGAVSRGTSPQVVASADSTEIGILMPRSAFLSRLALGLASIPLATTAWGMGYTLYNFRVRRVQVPVRNLPAGFEGLRIVQLSDIHSGSFSSRETVARGIAMALAEEPDLIVFTGDMVNDRAVEMEAWLPELARLKAPMGTFSVLGNHDYGDYVRWGSFEEKSQNLRHLKALQEQAGYRLLLNEHVRLERNGDSIVLAGVENWGKPPFPQYGDLEKALAGTQKNDCIILLSHDPTHWDQQVRQHPQPIALTLSGHTHGFQFGIELAGFQFSPVQLRYPHWAGLYSAGDRYLYVNRGFGFIGFPGRIGIPPEITVLELMSV